MTFLKYWLADLHSHFSENYEISQVTEPTNLIPNIAPKDLRLEDCSAYLCNTEGQHIVELRRKGEIISHFESVTVFTKQGEILPHANLKYVEFAHQALGYESYHFISDRQVHFLEPGDGSLHFSNRLPSILIGVPIYQRFTLTKVFCKYMIDYFTPSLVWKNYDVKLIFCGEEEDLGNLKQFKNDRVVFSCLPNNLGDKKNAILEYAKQTEVDYLLWIDSDDFFHPEVIEQLIRIAKWNGYWSAVKPFCFYDSQNHRLGYFEGYPQGHDLTDWGMGSGRVFTKELLNHMVTGFAKGNRSMDQSIKGALQDLEIDATERLLTDPTHLPIGVKTAQNIWSANSYKTTSMRNPNWLPYDIQELIENVTYDAK